MTDTDRQESDRAVRATALGVAWRDADATRPGTDPTSDELLVARLGPFADDDEAFYRPPGGGVEFGETTDGAVVREFAEELDADVSVERFDGVVENRFEFLGERDHELCFVYDVAFADDARYEKTGMRGVEHDTDVTYETEWATLDDLVARDEPLYPVGLRELLVSARTRVAPSRD